MLKLDSITKL